MIKKKKNSTAVALAIKRVSFPNFNFVLNYTFPQNRLEKWIYLRILEVKVIDLQTTEYHWNNFWENWLKTIKLDP